MGAVTNRSPREYIDALVTQTELFSSLDTEERDAVGSDEPPEEGVTLSDMMAMAAENEREVASNGTQGAVGDD